MKTLGDIFKSMGAQTDDCVSKGIVEKVNIKNETRSVLIRARFDSLVDFETLLNSQKSLSSVLGASVKIFPKYAPELFFVLVFSSALCSGKIRDTQHQRNAEQL